MAIDYKNRELSELYKEIEQNIVVLPNFQRGFVWSIEEQRKLLSSITVRIPIGSTLHLKGSKNDFSARGLCELTRVIPSKEECEYVLDGQQRLSTLKNTFYDVYATSSKWSPVWDSLFKQLRVRWFFAVEEDDIFGLSKLYFDENTIYELEPRMFLDVVKYKKIHKTKDHDKWYHPAYIPKDREGNIIIGSNEKKLHIAQKYAQEKLLPLYEIYQGDNGIHSKVIELIGKNKVEELKAKSKDIKEKAIIDYKDHIISLLSPVEDKIKEIFDDLNNNQIDQLFDELCTRWISQVQSFIKNIINIKMPIILLEQKEAGRAAAIFEEMNNGGTALSIYDLIVAKAANADSSSESLTTRIIQLLEKIESNMLGINKWKASYFTDVKQNMLSKSFQSIYLNSLAMLVAKQNESNIDKNIISRNSVLSLTPDAINQNNAHVLKALKRAYAFLQIRCGVISEKQVIYDYMMLPIIYFISEDSIWEDEKKLKILEAWYWSWLFSGKYKERQDDQFVKDIEYLKNILEKEQELNVSDFISDRIMNTPDYSDKITLLNNNEAIDNIAPKAMKDAILQYILSRKPLDFIPDDDKILTAYKAASNFEKDEDKNCKKYKLEAHHIIPLGIATKIGENSEQVRDDKTHVLNSPLNYTYISECANRAISNKDYALYKQELTNKISSHLLQLADYESLDNVKTCLENRFDHVQTTLKSEITELITQG